ncbi:MAG: ornithine lipid ester-linked acyl 2-hydroxylase [Sphingomonadales bacterium]|jgi:beta-hydroxylase|nr:ornithine lipid ester-linked acyl 2-hydroxylase [Sphingomonadales bacterium]
MDGRHYESRRLVSAPADRPAVPKRPLWLKIGKKLRHRIGAVIAWSSKVGDAPVYDSALFPWIARLEARWPEIRSEVDALLAREEGIPPLAEISPDHRRIAPPGKWRSFFLWGYGYRNDENIARCPKTAAAVAAIPGLNSAFFSILASGAHIPRHRGVTKAILTAHLGLVVPRQREACRMQVDDRMLHWDEGRTFVFDDCFHHEVWNDTNEQRVILLVQFRRPAGLLGRLVGGLFLAAVRRSRFVQDARSSLGDWEKAMQKLEREGG